MSQAELNIDNISRSLFRAEVNQSLQALASNSSGATEPTTPYPYQFWADTTSGILKQRNGANDAWINKGLLSDVYFGASGGSFTGLVNLNDGDDIASASTVDLTSATGNTVRITGTTAITAFTMNAGQQMELIAVGALPLTYNATTMNINGGASYTCAAGDRLSVTKDGAGVVRVSVTKQDGTTIVGGGNTITQGNSSVTITDAGTGKQEVTIDGVVIQENTFASRKSTIDGGSTLYPEFKCRAWVNFNGTGTVAIRGSGNVSSITDNGTGDYTINFTTAMPDVNYAVDIATNEAEKILWTANLGGFDPTVSALRFKSRTTSGIDADTSFNSVSIIR